MGGFLDFLSPALTVTSQAAGAYQGAQSQAAQDKAEHIIQALVMQRQAQQFALQQQLDKAKVGQVQSETYKNTREGDRLQEGDPGYIQYQTALAGGKAGAEFPYHIKEMLQKGQIDLHTAQTMAELEHGYKTQEIGQQGGIQGYLQGKQQDFEQGQQHRSQLFEGQQLGTRLKGEQANHLAGIRQTQSAQLIPAIVNRIRTGSWNPATSSTDATPATGAVEQQQHWDAAAQQLQHESPGVDPTTVLGARP